MGTELIRVDPLHFRSRDLSRAGEVLREGGLVGFPTETVYGIGVRADDEDAVNRLYDLKGRPSGKPLSYHIPDVESLGQIVPEIPPLASNLIERYWPGPLTLVLPGPGGTKVGVRLPGHGVARAVLRAAGVLILGTSANVADEPPAISGDEVLAKFPDRLDCIVDSGRSDLGEASTVVEVQGDEWTVLRTGFIDARAIRKAMGRTILFVCSGNTCRSPMAAALFRRALAEELGVIEEDLAAKGYFVRSAGTMALGGGTASDAAIETMRELELDVGPHTTRRLTPELVADAEFVLAMTGEQARLIREIAPDHSGRVFLVDPDGDGVLDPYGASMEIYRETAAQLERSVRAWARRVARER